MPIYTPRGLKIRLEPLFAFSLMSRLEPRTSPYEVLLTTEAIENAPGMAAFVALLATVASDQSPMTVFWAVLAACTLVASLTRSGMFIVPGLVPLSRIYAMFAGWGLFFVAGIILARITLGWPTALAYVAGRLIAGAVNGVLEMSKGRQYMKAIGHPFTSSEINFFSAYRLHAQELGVTTDITVSDEEDDAAKESILRFAEEHPAIALRFE